MATIRQYLIDGIFARGIFEDDARSIVGRLAADEMNDSMRGRWDEPTANYPAALIRMLEVEADAFVVSWMDENAPEHWARMLFATPDATRGGGER